MSWTATDPVRIGKAVKRADRQVRKPAGCWYRNIIPDHEKIDRAGLRCNEPWISDSNGNIPARDKLIYAGIIVFGMGTKCCRYEKWSDPEFIFLYLVKPMKRLENKEGKEMKMKKLAMLFAAAALSASMMAGCSGEQNETAVDAPAEKTEETAAAETAPAETASGETTAAEEEDGEKYDTGDASLDNVRNQDEIGDNELMIVSFGTSFNDSRRLTIGAIENAVEKAFPDYSVRRGFTSQIIIDHVKSRDDIAIDNVEEALERAEKNGVKILVIQPTHLMNGLEYTDLVNEVAEYSDAFEKVAIGEPLLTSDDDFKTVIQAITEATAEFDDGETAICFMGHGTEADSNRVYTKMQDMLAEAGYGNYFVGTVEAAPSLDDVLAAVKAGEYKKVVLRPLMIVAGDHANNDMAGEEEGSWKTAFEDAGYEVTCLVKGLGELEAIQQLFVEHAQAAVDSLKR